MHKLMKGVSLILLGALPLASPAADCSTLTEGAARKNCQDQEAERMRQQVPQKGRQERAPQEQPRAQQPPQARQEQPSPQRAQQELQRPPQPFQQKPAPPGVTPPPAAPDHPPAGTTGDRRPAPSLARPVAGQAQTGAPAAQDGGARRPLTEKPGTPTTSNPAANPQDRQRPAPYPGPALPATGVQEVRPARPGEAPRQPGGNPLEHPGSSVPATGKVLPPPLPPVYSPPQNVQTTQRGNGVQSHFNPQTRTTVVTDQAGHVSALEKPGLKAREFRADGRAGLVERSRPDGSRLMIQRGSRDARRIEAIRPDGLRIVNAGGKGSGFVERPAGRGYYARTYVRDHRTVVRVYRTTAYAGMRIYQYVPPVRYRPAFYGWALRPWYRPVVYYWPVAPSQTYYRAYFRPEPAYPRLTLWLTDFILGAYLQGAYESQFYAYESMPPAQPDYLSMPPEVKMAIEAEVSKEIQAEQSFSMVPPDLRTQADAGLPPALSPEHRVFVVNTAVEILSQADGRLCVLTPGDVIERVSETVSNTGRVGILVLASKNPDCARPFEAEIDLATLQEMHNQFREQIVSGLGDLPANSAKLGMPPPPPSYSEPYAPGQASVDPQANAILQEQSREADQLEEEARIVPWGGSR